MEYLKGEASKIDGTGTSHDHDLRPRYTCRFPWILSCLEPRVLGNSMEYPPAIKRGWLENAHHWGFNRKNIYRIGNFHTFRVSAQIPSSDVRDKTDKTADLFSEAPL